MSLYIWLLAIRPLVLQSENKQKQASIIVIAEDKVTDFYCIADVFCKFFDSLI